MTATRLRQRSAPPDAAVLLANMPSAVLTVDRELHIRWANPAAEQLFTASLAMLEARPLGDFLVAHATLLDLIRQAQQSGSSISDYGVELALARGEVVSVDSHLTPLVELPELTLIVLHPCSVAKRLDQHMANRGSSRSAAAMARTLAHEVKNPLSGIRGAAQLLEPYIGDEDKPLVRLICDEADRIVDLVDRMEEFADSGPVERNPVNIHLVLEHVRRIAGAGFARAHRIVEQYDPSLPEVEGDRDKLVQVFLNLVKNAAEATSADSGQITLVTHYQHGLRLSVTNSRERLDLPITVEVRDNGPGVLEDMRDNLFEPFITTKTKGRGLGLSLVAKIVADHGGIVSYASGDPGAIFRVRLPAAHRPRSGAGRPA